MGEQAPTLWEEISAAADATSKRFLRRSKDTAFNPHQRLEILQGELTLLGAPTSREFTTTILSLFGLQIASLAKEESALVLGVRKKGLALLREVGFSLNLAEDRILDDRQLDSNRLQGKSVILVDDSIHTGKTCRDLIRQLRAADVASIEIVTILASREGREVIQREFPEVSVKAILAVPEKLFGLYFPFILTPLLDIIRTGAISNRPHSVLQIAAPRYDAIAWGRDVLVALQGMNLADSLVELPYLDGTSSPIFHGTLELSRTAIETIQSDLGGCDVEQAKIRLYIDPKNPLTVHAYAIIWFVAPAGATTAKVNEMELEVCTKLLDRFEQELKAALGDRYGVTRIARRP